MNESTHTPLVLVAYASKHGATGEIAHRIAQTLSTAGVPAEAHDVNTVTEPTRYYSIVVGSAVYAGHWLKEAAHFLENNEAALVSRPVWLFSSGPTGNGEPSALLDGWRFPANLEALAERIHARGTALFHGAIDLAKLGFGERLMMRAVKGATGDFRDWAMIDCWASLIASEIKQILSEAPLKAAA